MKYKQFRNFKYNKKRNQVDDCHLCRGSVTVETALVLPLFMCFCIQLMSIISLFQLHSAIEAALHQEVAIASLNAYALQDAQIGGINGGDVVNALGITGKVVSRVGREYLDKSMIVGGSGGIRNIPSPSLGDQDTVDVVLSYEVKPYIDILGFSRFTLGNRVRMKKWTGYVLDPVGDNRDEDPLVYVTENGTVYHKNRNCSHIMLSIGTVPYKSLEGLRNNGGEKYHSCESCGKNHGANVFITDEGNKYHSSLGCSGLKRTVYVVRLSEAGGKGPCSRCG